MKSLLTMWRANKRGLICLGGGLLLLGGLHHLISQNNEPLADQVLALGFCLLLFGVALSSWLSVRAVPDVADEGDDASPPEEEDTPERRG